jgi:hypothetical protein
MVQVKGSTLVPRLHYLEARASAEEKRRVLDRLAPGFRERIAKGLMPSEWYAFEDFIALIRAMDQVLGRGDPGFVPELARYAAERSLTTIYKVFYKIGSPEFIVTRAVRVWNQYYSSGRLQVWTLGPKRVKMVLEDFETPAREHCLSVRGWIERTLEMSGGQNVKVDEVQCRAQGRPVCEFLATWT